MKKLVILTLALICPILNAFESNIIEGVYSGTMEVQDTKVHTVGLQISLTITDEFVDAPLDSPFTYQKVIHGSFVIDGEGGPYAFSKVQYDISTGKIDMRYNRPSISMTPTSPYNLRFMGYLKGKVLSGRSMSGVKGRLGEFNVTKDPSIKYLQRDQKYYGTWLGSWKFKNKNSLSEVKLVLQPSLMHTINPPQFELDYTSGRTGYVDFDSYRLAFTNVAVDYLRRLVIIHCARAGGGLVTLTGTFDTDGNLSGLATSTFQGETGEFNLSPDKGSYWKE